MPILEQIQNHALTNPDATAIGAPGRRDLTYKALLGQIDYCRGALQGQGLVATDRVAVVLPNGPEMAVAFLGVSASCVCAPLNPAYRRV